MLEVVHTDIICNVTKLILRLGYSLVTHERNTEHVICCDR